VETSKEGRAISFLDSCSGKEERRTWEKLSGQLLGEKKLADKKKNLEKASETADPGEKEGELKKEQRK
jgi:hypothetical protein